MVSGFFLPVAGLGSGGDGRDRTADLLIANQSLSQLSYAPKVGTNCTRAILRRQMGTISEMHAIGCCAGRVLCQAPSLFGAGA